MVNSSDKIKYHHFGVERLSETTSDSVVGFGVLAGYKQFFTDKFGVRYYGLFNYAKYNIGPAYNINTNVDVLYNFANVDSIEFGAFGGLSLGYISYDYEIIDIKGFDLGINLGLKAQIAENHGIEFYSRFGLLEVKNDYTSYEPIEVKGSHKIRQPYQIGVRYTSKSVAN